MTKKDEVAHIHYWNYQANDLSSRHCACGGIMVSTAELQRRTDEWNNYFDLVKTTPSYMEFLDMRKAYVAHDHETMNAIRERIKERTNQTETEWGDLVIELKDPLPKPNFPDPTTWNKYFVA